jgi:hypothetical protein
VHIPPPDEKALGQTIIVENVAEAAGGIGAAGAGNPDRQRQRIEDDMRPVAARIRERTLKFD